MTDAYEFNIPDNPEDEAAREEESPRDEARPMDISEYAAILAAEIEAALDGDRTSYSKDRERALDYYLGKMPDTPAPEGRSKAISRDVSDTIDWMLPSLMRVFFNSDEVVKYLPTRPDDVLKARQATDYINNKFITELDGYNLCWDAFQDMLLMRLGIIKFYWDGTPEYKTESYTGLTDDGLAQVLNDPNAEILEHETTVETAVQADPAAPAETFNLHNAKVRYLRRHGRIICKSVAPEEFRINAEATAVDSDTTRFVCHVSPQTRSSLIEQGFDREKVEDLPTDHDIDLTPEAIARRDEFTPGQQWAAKMDKSQELVQVYDCYLLADLDGDGVSRWTHCVMAGGMGEENILQGPDEWDDPIPFADFVSWRIAHRWQGRSIADSTMDIQQVKTVLLRGTLDNIYENNNPQKVVVTSDIENPDELINPNFGGIIRVKRTVESVRKLENNFVATDIYGMMSYMDDMIAKRTGVSRQTMALDPETLQNQSATAAQLQNDSSYSKIELIARNVAEGGMRTLFKGLLRLFIKHQNRAEVIRLRDNFVEFDPRSWNAEMDVSIDVGLGTGSSDRDALALTQVLAMQKETVATLGPANPVVKPTQLYNTIAKMISASGLRSPDEYFTPVSDEDFAQWMQQQQEAAKQNQPPPDPLVMVEMQKVQVSAEKDKTDAQIKMAEMQGKQQKEAIELQLDREKIAIEREKVDLDRQKLELERMKLASEHHIKDAEMRGAVDQELIRSGLPPANYSFNDDRQQFQALLGQLAQQNVALLQGFQALASAMMAPKSVTTPEGRTYTTRSAMN